MKAACLTTLALFGAHIFAQADNLIFEEASIRQSPPEVENSMVQPMPGGGLRVEGMSLRPLITWAYQIQNYQLTGGPAWVQDLRWNILAKAPAPADATAPLEYEKMNDAQRTRMQDVVRRRTQALLADRFQLVLRHESREQTIYALTITKGGSKLRESADQSQAGTLIRRPGTLDCRGCLLDAAMQFLAVDLQRPVSNLTGLTAHYDFKLVWTPERRAGADADGKESETGPTVFTAIQEQLGLKLESTKGPVETLVIERAEKPDN